MCIILETCEKAGLALLHDTKKNTFLFDVKRNKDSKFKNTPYR